MKRITIRELHMKTGAWIREAARSEEIVVTDRGVPVAVLKGYEGEDLARSFASRRETVAFSHLPPVGGDSTRSISDDRDRS